MVNKVLAALLVFTGAMAFGLWRRLPRPLSARLRIGQAGIWVAPFLFAVLALFPTTRLSWLMTVAFAIATVGFFASWVARGESPLGKEGRID